MEKTLRTKQEPDYLTTNGTLSLEDILRRVSRTCNRAMFNPRDAANYEHNLVQRLQEPGTHETRHARETLLKESYLARIIAYAPYRHADAVPLSKAERWLK